MLKLADDWSFEVDPTRTASWMSPKGFWGFEVRCQPTPIRSGGLTEELAPLLRFEGLPLEVGSWKELPGLELYQHRDAWDGMEDQPTAVFGIDDESGLRDAKVRVLATQGTQLKIEVEAVTDVFYDEGHDTDVRLVFAGLVPFEGVRFRFHAEGLASRDPEGRANEILAGLLDHTAFGEPLVEKIEAGIFAAHFPPRVEEAVEEEEELVDMETRHARNSATELLQALAQQEWIELEEGGAARLAVNLVPMLDLGRGRRRAEAVSEWLLEQDDVVDLHCSDEDLGRLLDKFW